MKKIKWLLVFAVLGLTTFSGANAADTVKVAFVVPLSGPFANVGEDWHRHATFVTDEINKRGGVLGGRKFELIPMDNKNSPQEALLLLSQVVDRGIQIISFCCGSHVAVPLSEAVERHNTRNPDRRILLLVSAGDQDITSEKCSFWSFAFMSKGEIFADVATTYLARQPKVKRVYLINQDYVWGHQNQKFFREMLAKKRPDIRIVGDDLHPMGKVKDFAPYVAKINASKADVVMTANWGNDMTLLVKAAAETGLDAQFYTYYASLWGAPAAMGKAAADRVKAVFRWHPNAGIEKEEILMQEFQRRFDADYGAMPASNEFNMLAKAIDIAGSTDPLRVAYALEDIRIQGNMGEVWMRPDDHQLFEPMYIMTLTSVNGKDVKYGLEGTNIGTRTDARIEIPETLVPTRCQMKRPPRP